ncbi:MAG TPA: response regulator transcription factor [Acidimicrobiales bacterium]|nr:response regulator transcription factor [Acidimicrobiales bacterium]
MTVDSRRSVLLVDDHLTFSEAFALAVDETDDLHCVGTVSSLAEAMAALDRLDPDVVVLDLGLPDAQGASAVAQLLHGHRDRRILVLTGRLELELLRQALDAGAAGFLHKDSPIAVVLDAMRSLPRHCVVVRPSMLLALLQRHTGQPLPASAGILSRRELEVLGLLADGLTPKVIASQLGISITTCRGYIKNVLSRMGAHSQLEAVSMARREGLL